MAALLGLEDMPEVAGKGKSKKFQLMKKLNETQNDLQERLKQNSKASTWFDVGAPATRARRALLRRNFEEFVEVTHGHTELRDIYNIDTFTEYCKEFLEVMIDVSTGRISDKIRTDVLWQHKEALYYYAVRAIDNFGAAFPSWHVKLVSHIHYLAKKYVLGKTHLHKSHLGSPELQLAWLWLLKLQIGVENAKQHYAAWVLTYVTAVRPGSITVAAGYAKGDTLGADLTRDHDETLRWRDIEFIQLEGIDGIAAKITFRFLKGHMNPYTRRMVVGQKVFTFLPTRGSMYQLDMSAVLLALAFSRGLFPFKTMEDLLECDLTYIPKNAAIDTQAVFVQASQSGELDVKKPMREAALNRVLQKMCADIGLLERNTMYSLRRLAITEVQRAQGTELARQFANHTPDSNTVLSYDVTGLSDLDISALRVGDSEAIPRQTIRDSFAQVNMTKTADTVDLKTELTQRTEVAVASHPDYISIEAELSTMLDDLATFLDIPPITINVQVFPAYKRALKENGSEEALDAADKLDKLLAKRKLLRKNLRKTMFNKVKAEYKDEHSAMLKANRKKAVTPHGAGRQPEAIRSAFGEGASAGNSETAELAQIEAIGDDDFVDDDTESTVDEAAVETAHDEAEEASRDAPTFWNQLGDEVVIMPEYSEEGGGNVTKLLSFLKTFAGLSSVANSNLKCTLCALDPTVPQSEKDRRWPLLRLKKHYKSAYHSRNLQLTRAAENTQSATVECPLCREEFKKRDFAEHIDEDHPENFIF